MEKFIVPFIVILALITGTFVPMVAEAGQGPQMGHIERPQWECPGRYTEADMDRGLDVIEGVYDSTVLQGSHRLRLVSEQTTIVVCGLAYPALPKPSKGQKRTLRPPVKSVATRGHSAPAEKPITIPQAYTGRAERAFKQAVAEVVQNELQDAGRRLTAGTIVPVSSSDLLQHAFNDSESAAEESGVITWDLPRQPAGARVPGARQSHVLPRVESVAASPCFSAFQGASSTTTYASGALEDPRFSMKGGGTCPPGTELVVDDDPE